MTTDNGFGRYLEKNRKPTTREAMHSRTADRGEGGAPPRGTDETDTGFGRYLNRAE